MFGPSAALKRGPNSAPTIVLDRRLNHATRLHLAGPKIVTSHKGRLTITGHDSAGHHTYIVVFGPSISSLFGYSETTRELTVTS